MIHLIEHPKETEKMGQLEEDIVVKYTRLRYSICGIIMLYLFLKK